MIFPELTEDDIKKMMEEDFKKGALCIGPSSWERYARLLKRAADIIFEVYKVPYDKLCSRQYPYYEMNVDFGQDDEDIHLKEIYYMLLGYSIENLVKAIIMITHRENLTEEGLSKINKHETYDLLNENGITEFREYDAILKVMAEYTKWKGRYPVPLKQEYFSWSLDMFDPKDANNLYEKLYRRLNLEKRLKDLRDKHKIDKSLKEFLDIQKEIVDFIDIDTEIKEVLDTYRYPWPLIKEVLKNYSKDLPIEDPTAIEIRRKIWIYENS
jgi:hypothetical protein